MWSFIYDAQAQAAVLFEVAERELRPSWFDAQANLDRELTAVAKLSARACYVLFLLVTFSLCRSEGLDRTRSRDLARFCY